MIEMQRTQIADLKRQLEWFRRQVFGSKSERLTVLENAEQMSLGEGLTVGASSALPKVQTVAAHARRIALPAGRAARDRASRSSMRTAYRSRRSSCRTRR